MTLIIDFLRSIPDVVWSGIVASVITLSGVMLSNSSNTKRLKLQLAHDGAEKSKERIASLRRQVYLEAAEEIVKASNHLSTLPQMDPAKQNMAEGLHGFFKSAAKLQLVCDLRTSVLIGELVTQYGELLFKLMTKVQPIHEQQIDIAISDRFYEQERNELTRVLAAMTQLNESGKLDADVFSTLQRSLDFHQIQLDKHSQDRATAWEKRNAFHKLFVHELLAEMKSIGQAQIPVIVAIRRELDLDGDVRSFQEQMHANWKRIERGLDDALAAMQ